MRVDDDVVDCPAEEGARLVSLALLADADEASRRLERASDDEALHDFRVGLRRLRSTLRAFRPWLEESVGRKLEQRLRKVARATNAVRDSEVQLSWLASKQDALASRRLRSGLELLVDRIQAKRRDAPQPGGLVDRYRATAVKLGRRLGTYERHVGPGRPAGEASFGGVLAKLLTDEVHAVRQRIARIESSLDQGAVHGARIELKRLRYLVEPLKGNRHADSGEAVRHLKCLQDLLGELHDIHVLAHEVEGALVDAAAARARQLHAAVYERGARGAELRKSAQSPRAGLLAIARLARERREALFADLDREWRGGALDALARELEAIATSLELRAGGKLGRERKYLLAGVPQRAAEVHAIAIDQGWLPGSRLRERIRRVRGRDGERYWRGLKQGTGRARLETEEETSREVFEALWPLTEGRRIAKLRRKLEDAGLVWEIDEFTSADLVVAEVELPPGAGETALPDWLRPLVVREVTDDPAYLNENVAIDGIPGSAAGRPPPDPHPDGSDPRVDGGAAEGPVAAPH